jgi:contractile injection system tube protein
MALEKAVLLITATGESIPVQFNPEEYTLDDGNVFAEIGIPGLRTPPVQFVRGSGRSLRVELFFDTSSSSGADVRLQTQRVAGLLEKSPTLHGPSPLLFLWGGLQMPCVLEKVSQRFTRFLPSGVPVRAYLTLTLKEFATTTVEVQSGLFVLPPTVANLAGGANLAQVTAQTLGNPADWRVLANANNIDNPRTMDNRSTLAVPAPRTS